jgi:galactokinase
VAIDFEDPGRPRIEKLSFDFSAAGWALTVVDSGGSHADLTGDYAAIPEEMKAVAAFFGRPTLRGLSADELLARVSEVRMAAGDRAVMRALHYFEENERVVRQAAALEAGDLDCYLELVQASGQSSWKLLQNCSPAGARREQALALALSLSEKWLAGRGVCRVHGGGFAGTIQAYVPLGLLADYGRRMRGVFGPDCLRELRIRQPGALEIAPE